MSVTINENYPRAEGISRNLELSSVTLDISSEDVTGGISFDFENYVRGDGLVFVQPTSGYVFDYDYTNKVIQVYEAAADGNPLDLVEKTISVSDVKVLIIGTG